MFNRELEGLRDGGLLECGYDDALISVVAGNGCYDRSRCIAMLMTRCDMSEAAAEEYFSFNVESAQTGDHAPVFIDESNSPDPADEP